MGFISFNLIWLLAYFNIGEFLRIECPLENENINCECKDENNIKEIDCFRLSLTEIPKFKFSDIEYDILKIESNLIKNIPTRAFSNLRVRGIVIKEKSLETIEDNAFSEIRVTLKKLEIKGNKIQLSKSMFNGIRDLEELSLTNFNIEKGQLPDKVFNQLANIKSLTLSDIGLKSIRENELPITFNTLASKLRLINNEISNFAVFGEAKQLKELDLTNNLISEIHEGSLQNLKKLEILDLTNNKITKIQERAFEHLTNLKEIRLKNTNFKSSQLTTISNLINLETLDLSNNKGITDIPNDLFISINKLKIFKLNNCNIKQLRYRQFKGTDNSLLELEINENYDLRNIDVDTFSKHQNIKKLSFQKTDLGGSLTERHFSTLENSLEELKMRNAKLINRDLSIVKPLSSLKILDLHSVEINRIEDNLFVNTNLESLTLSNNPIETVNRKTFAGLSGSLKKLYLEGTRVSTISACVFLGFDLDHIELPDVDCDCRLKWLHRWMKAQEFPDHHGKWNCKSPQNLIRREFGSLKENDLVCGSGIEENKCDTVISPSSTVPSNQEAFRYTNISKLTSTSLKVTWQLGGLYSSVQIDSFKITYQLVNSLEPREETEPIQSDKREKILENLQENTKYLVCIWLKVKGEKEYTSKNCTSAFTQPVKTTSEPSSSSTVSIALGVVFGLLAVFLIIGIIIFILFKKRKAKKDIQHTYDKPVTNSDPELPRLGRDSKRYTKSPRSKSNANSTTNLIPSVSSISQYPHSQLDDLTPFERERIISILSRPESVSSSQYHLMSQDERYRLINKLTTSGVSGYSAFSSNSRDSGVTMNTSGATGPKLPPRPQHLEGYLNPLELGYDPKLYTEENIYCEIANPKDDTKLRITPQGIV